MLSTPCLPFVLILGLNGVRDSEPAETSLSPVVLPDWGTFWRCYYQVEWRSEGSTFNEVTDIRSLLSSQPARFFCELFLQFLLHCDETHPPRTLQVTELQLHTLSAARKTASTNLLLYMLATVQSLCYQEEQKRAGRLLKEMHLAKMGNCSSSSSCFK